MLTMIALALLALVVAWLALRVLALLCRLLATAALLLFRGTAIVAGVAAAVWLVWFVAQCLI